MKSSLVKGSVEEETIILTQLFFLLRERVTASFCLVPDSFIFLLLLPPPPPSFSPIIWRARKKRKDGKWLLNKVYSEFRLEERGLPYSLPHARFSRFRIRVRAASQRPDPHASCRHATFMSSVPHLLPTFNPLLSFLSFLLLAVFFSILPVIAGEELGCWGCTYVRTHVHVYIHPQNTTMSFLLICHCWGKIKCLVLVENLISSSRSFHYSTSFSLHRMGN